MTLELSEGGSLPEEFLKAAQKSSSFKEIGASGLNYSESGNVYEELHPNLAGRKALETWRSMKDNDALVGAILYAIDMMVRQVDWRVDEQGAKRKDAEFLESCLHDMSHSWGDFISEVLSMLPFGFSFHEIVYKRRNGPKGALPSRYNDGKIGWRKLPIRSQETLDHWVFDDEGGVTAFVQRVPPSYDERTIPLAKGLLFRTSVHKNSPEGVSLLRSAYTSWFYKKRLQGLEGTGIERDLAGFPIFWLPAEYMASDATPEQKNVVRAFEQMGQNVRRDKQEYMIMPLAYTEGGNKAYDFSLMSSSGTRAYDTSQIIERYNQEIAMSVLSDFILLGHESVGSFALSSSKTDLFGISLGTILDTIADVLNRFAVPRLFEINGMDTTELPAIVHGDVEKPDLTSLGQYLTSLANVGMQLFPDKDLEFYLRDAASLPEKSAETIKEQEELKRQQEEAIQGAAAGAAEAPEGEVPPPGADDPEAQFIAGEGEDKRVLLSEEDLAKEREANKLLNEIMAWTTDELDEEAEELAEASTAPTEEAPEGEPTPEPESPSEPPQKPASDVSAKQEKNNAIG